MNDQGSVLSDDKKDPCSEYPKLISEDCRTGGYEICYNEMNTKHPRKEYNFGHGVTSYKNFLCASDFKVSASDLKGVKSDWKDH